MCWCLRTSSQWEIVLGTLLPKRSQTQKSEIQLYSFICELLSDFNCKGSSAIRQNLGSTLQYSHSTWMFWSSVLFKFYMRTTVAAKHCWCREREQVVTAKEKLLSFIKKLDKTSRRNHWLQLHVNNCSRRQHWEDFCAFLVQFQPIFANAASGLCLFFSF